MLDHRRSSHSFAGCALAVGLALSTAIAAAADPPPPGSADPQAPADAATERGRRAYLEGIKLAKAEQWGDALVAFEEAAAARDAPLVQFNIAYCQRALGRYLAARETTRRVLKDPTGLAPSQIEDSKAYLAEFEKILVEIKVTLDPPTATLTLDGRPLVPAKDQADTWLASLAPPGEGGSPGKKEFTVVVDPGVHLFRAVRPGHQDAVIQKSYRPGDKESKLNLRLDVLPATISLKSDPGAAIVRVDKREVGITPIEFERPAGRYALEVEQDKFVTYTATLDLHAGQRSDLTAKLVPEPITKRKWFAPVVVVGSLLVAGGIAGVAIAVTRHPVPPPYDGGTTGWVAPPQGFHF